MPEADFASAPVFGAVVFVHVGSWLKWLAASRQRIGGAVVEERWRRNGDGRGVDTRANEVGKC